MLRTLKTCWKEKKRSETVVGLAGDSISTYSVRTTICRFQTENGNGKLFINHHEKKRRLQLPTSLNFFFNSFRNVTINFVSSLKNM